MVPYQLQLYAERTDAPADRVGELLLKRADEIDAAMVILAAHNKVPGRGAATRMLQRLRRVVGQGVTARAVGCCSRAALSLPKKICSGKGGPCLGGPVPHLGRQQL
jgi:hypothetical protein